jgi:hypothetical protein
MVKIIDLILAYLFSIIKIAALGLLLYYIFKELFRKEK